MIKMRNINNICKYYLLLAFILTSCGAPASRTGVVQDKRMKAERKFDPVGDTRDKDIITGRHSSRLNAHASGNADSLVLEKEQQIEPSSDDTLTILFRVQVYASKSVDEANQYAASIKELFPEGIFVEYQAPYYKVRVGGFHKASDGDLYLERVKQLGFDNAWLIRVAR